MLLQYSPWNVKEFADINGYDLISCILKKNRWVLDEVMLGLLFNIVGLEKSSRTNVYSSGVISNLIALKALLLDWR
jgi:hypothetical protein